MFAMAFSACLDVTDRNRLAGVEVLPIWPRR